MAKTRQERLPIGLRYSIVGHPHATDEAYAPPGIDRGGGSIIVRVVTRELKLPARFMA
jgi:hypothetical protein